MVFGAGNYVLAKLQWNPNQDAALLLKNYYKSAYGVKAAPFIGQLFNVLDTAWNKYMNAHERANYSLTEEHLKEIYGPNYQEIEQQFLKALAVKKEPVQQQRIELFGQVLSIMQWNLRKLGLIPADYKSSLTLTDDKIDQILSNQKEDGRITRYGIFRTEKFSALELMPALPDAKSQQSPILPVSGTLRMLIYPINAGVVNINVKAFNGRGEFIQYTLTTSDGEQIKAGAVCEGRMISYNAEKGKSYLLDIPSRGASMKLEVTGAAIAYKSNLLNNAFQVAADKYMDGPVPVYFQVPEDIKNFNITLGTKDALADLYSPDGKLIGKLNCSESTVSRLDITGKNVRPGFWKIVLQKFQGSSITLTLGETIPQWLIPDPGRPIRILTVN